MEPEPLQHARVEVRAIRVFGIGDKLIEVGEIISVSASRASYLAFLQLVEKQ